MAQKRHKIRILRGRGVGGRRWDTLLAKKILGVKGVGGSKSEVNHILGHCVAK